MPSFKSPLLGPAAAGVLCLSGCGTPSVVYDTAQDSDYNIRSGQIVFALRSSDVMLMPSSAKVADVCNWDKKADLRAAWSKCLSAVTVQTTPTVPKSPVYVARPADSNPFAHTKLAATSLNDELPNIDTVTVAFSDNTSQFITSVGSGATTGLMFGPGGAFVGGLIGAAGGAITNKNNYEFLSALEDRADWTDLVCDDVPIGDKPSYLAKASTLPVLLSPPYQIKQAEVPDTDKSCWHALPGSPLSEPSSGSVAAGLEWTGWVYRLVLLDAPKGAMAKTDAKYATYFDGKTVQTSFPYVPCQEAMLEIAWWSELQLGGTQMRYRAYVLKVANSNYVRFADLPKGGTIKLGTVCNAQVTFGSYTGSAAQADVDATLKAVSDFKTAQQKAEAAAKAAAKPASGAN